MWHIFTPRPFTGPDLWTDQMSLEDGGRVRDGAQGGKDAGEAEYWTERAAFEDLR